MEKEHVYESAVETAKKIRSMLKQAYPGIKFSVRSSTYSMGSSVDVHWVDGPLTEEVDKILNRFKSGYFDGMEDMYISTGYEWEGKIVSGAKYISGTRSLSDYRKSKILKELQERYEPDPYGEYYVRHWTEAEKGLIESGVLLGFISKVQLSKKEDKETEPKVTMAQVIPFPVRAVKDPNLSASLKAERLMNSLTPEQQLKLVMLQEVLGKEEVADCLMGGTSVDYLFEVTALHIFGGGQG
ncbi:hypothetical protein M5X00_23195 [Paenibacillus alvei]|uniref:Large polyvalent protein associated domain-containing protein n=1 Tax=Paenibacillus alvei TaxID=44250 RepID=A0ABT4H2E3_PAEAL|nr:LPD29 domain-containing protein [Paenibacillus alvei]EJW14312.1 hypothetical protein PAV_14c00050 [Paenibacillus alvei DSM 29]MCY9540566.1 hypothetical protein [Paenibacillus alvei]MCY9737316.1 hypothetical protein [Paenibacillus alvei]MCY9757148.1 hypothetical protein [Paenibacillus alvei]MCY9763148.1 hypothetical protein [Paenibacillus alvei]